MKIINSTENFLKNHSYIGIFLLRLFIGLRLIYGVIDNIISWNEMIEFSEFLESNHFPIPVVSAIVSVYAQFIFGVCVLIGLKTRLASFMLILNFLVAICVHLKMGDTVEGTTPALAMLFGCLALLFTGAGKLSTDAKSKKRLRIKSYLMMKHSLFRSIGTTYTFILKLSSL